MTSPGDDDAEIVEEVPLRSVTRRGAAIDVVADRTRKSLADLAGSLSSGRLASRLASLAETPRAAVVVEDRYSAVFKLEHVRPALVADQLGECQVRWPTVPVIFAETRPLAQEWTYRFMAAAMQEHLAGREAVRLLPHRTTLDD